MPQYQSTWFGAVEDRINLTSHALSSLNSVKLLGMARQMEKRIQEKRRWEMMVSQKFRFNNCLALTFCTPASMPAVPRKCGRTHTLTSTALFPLVLSPLITFIIYSASRSAADDTSFAVTKAVTSLSILSLMSTPARRLLFAIPFGLQALGSFSRMQKFLLLEEHLEPLTITATTTSSTLEDPRQAHELNSEHKSEPSQEKEKPVILIRDAGFGWSADGPPIVSLNHLSIAKGSFTAITGPIGCGKSTLLKGLLSETACTQGNVQVSTTDIAYCGQTPWIYEGTIRDNIVGESEFDAVCYNAVLSSCELDSDLSRMPSGDATMVGSRGSNISGGQRQRIVRRALEQYASFFFFFSILE